MSATSGSRRPRVGIHLCRSSSNIKFVFTTRGSPLLWRLALFTLGVNFFYNLWRLDLRASNLFVSHHRRMPVRVYDHRSS